jgi:integrase
VDRAGSKNRESYVVALQPEALKILAQRFNDRTQDVWVFPSFGATGHLVDLKKRWAALLKRAKISGVRQHDLGRTYGSWAAAAGTPLLTIGKGLGHRNTAATQIYSQLDLAPVRAAFAPVTAAISKAMKAKPKALPAPVALPKSA